MQMVQKQQDKREKINSTCMRSVWSGQQGAGNPGPALGSGGSGFSDERSSVAKQSANSGSFRSHSKCLGKWKKGLCIFSHKRPKIVRVRCWKWNKKTDRIKGANGSRRN